MSVGNKIRSIRMNLGMTQEEFGNLFNATRSNVSKWERGSSLPNKTRLKAIADIGNMSVDELLGKDTVTISKDEYNNLLEISEKYENIIKEDNSWRGLNVERWG